MDYESLVYGCIIDTPSENSERRVINSNAMSSLPSADQWPFLAKEMFSEPANPGSGQSRVVHFGASYRGIEYEWQSWLEQFEQLLQRMYWVSAKVHLETVLSGTHTFTWETSGDWHTPGSGDMSVHCEWSRDESF
ncbi:hypothetical protein [Halioxenophilus sp. WMMB6]|uniref:hypothetical protein n=1 Tax=Halioxenophilus sp. WMMB6 TaxID=3073815 RepID=UPI00295F2D04|nr:hypothetical protein [Halioxenophilus sp. WMMB6]